MLEQSMNGRVNTLGKITCIQTCECFAFRSHSPNRTWVNGGGVCHSSICRGWIYIYVISVGRESPVLPGWLPARLPILPSLFRVGDTHLQQPSSGTSLLLDLKRTARSTTGRGPSTSSRSRKSQRPGRRSCSMPLRSTRKSTATVLESKGSL
jgi:hypothetical protein